MQEMANNFIESTAQCWACGVFDHLFAIISNTAAAAYQRLTFFSVVIFAALFAFYTLNVIWQNIKNGGEDSLFSKSLQPVIIKSVIALTLLAMGIMVPQLISKLTLEPVATLTLKFAEIISPSNGTNDTYQAISLGANGFFRPELRDTILQIIKTSVSTFQVFIEMGINVIEEAFSVEALMGGIGVLVKHILVAFIGVFLTYNFGKLFIKYSLCFMDIIMSMAIFAFLFPLSLVLFIFQGAKDVPDWISSMGKSLGGGQIKKIINAIVSVLATIFTYTVIMVIISGYLGWNNADAQSFQESTKSLFELDLENSNAMQLTFIGSIVLVYVINYIASKIQEITSKIMSTLGLSVENSLSEEMGNSALRLTELAYDNTKKVIKAIAKPEEVIKEAGKK